MTRQTGGSAWAATSTRSRLCLGGVVLGETRIDWTPSLLTVLVDQTWTCGTVMPSLMRMRTSLARSRMNLSLGENGLPIRKKARRRLALTISFLVMDPVDRQRAQGGGLASSLLMAHGSIHDGGASVENATLAPPRPWSTLPLDTLVFVRDRLTFARPSLGPRPENSGFQIHMAIMSTTPSTIVPTPSGTRRRHRRKLGSCSHCRCVWEVVVDDLDEDGGEHDRTQCGRHAYEEEVLGLLRSSLR